MYIGVLSLQEIPAWVEKNKTSVLMVRKVGCVPCQKAYPLYYKLADKYPHMEFGIYTATFEDDKEFLRSLVLRATPSFYVFNDVAKMMPVFDTSSAKNIPLLEDYLRSLSLDSHQTLP